MKPEPQSDDDAAFNRIMLRMAEGFDIAACVAMTLNIDREIFIEGAERAFDFMQRHHNANWEYSDEPN